MIEKVKEVGIALKAGCYHCALALTLTFPDICGKIAYPELNKRSESSKRYQKWYDEYVAKYYDYGNKSFSNGSNVLINGYACYLLRCIYLHNGCYDLGEQYPKIKIKSFRLYYDKHSVLYGGYNVVNDTEKDFSLDIDIATFCHAICIATTNLYNNHKEQFKNELILDCSWDNETVEQIFRTNG